MDTGSMMAEKNLTKAEIDAFTKVSSVLQSKMASIIYGQDEKIRYILATLFAGGHILLEDMPGTGKTTLAILLSRLVSKKDGSESFKRIQFTPDLLPMDITGANVYNPDKRDFVFRPGPVFTNFLLADELNRASPKVQSALLQCMAERHVSVENATYPLKPPFFVMATQNPLETEGTYALPIAQLDRFYAKVALATVDREVNRRILRDYAKIVSFEGISPVATLDDVLKFQAMVDRVVASEDVIDLIVDIIVETRSRKDAIRHGASPRASIIYLKMAKAWALLDGRPYVTDTDVKRIGTVCLGHRLRYAGKGAEEGILEGIIDSCVERHSKPAV
jgi:MoxR-like ATPase